MTGTSQNAISRLESTTYGKATLTTLKKLAAVYDVGLIVRFVPFSQLVNWESSTPYLERGFGPGAFEVQPFEEEEKSGALDRERDGTMDTETYRVLAPPVAAVRNPLPDVSTPSGNILDLAEESPRPPDTNVLVEISRRFRALPSNRTPAARIPRRRFKKRTA